MSSPEVERFEMSDRDYSQIMDPTGAGRNRQTKNQATYGIWADKDSDGSGDEFVGFGGQSQRRMPSASGSKGSSGSNISFVSGGFKGEESKTPREDMDPMSVDSWIHKKRSSKAEAPMPRYVKGHQADLEQDYGAWQKHTRGIGQKLLLKMGHKPGMGLGKNSQGITTPVQAVKRKGRGAIAYHGTERSARSLKDFPIQDEEEEEDKEFVKQMSQWKRQPVEGKKQKPKYVYRTAQEVLETGGKKQKPSVGSAPKVKVIDMTGREQRVLSGYHAIGKTHDRPDEEEELVQEMVKKEQVFLMPELMHNLNLLVEMAEDDIISNDRQIRYDEDHLVALKYEAERLDSVVEQEGEQLARLQKVVDLVTSCETRSKPDSPDPLTLDTCLSIFQALQQDYYEEYKLYDLSSLAMALVFPLMRKFFSTWQPLEAPSYGLHTVLEWQLMLGADFSSGDQTTLSSMDVYQRLIWEIWLPPVRSTILSWSVRNTDPMIQLLDTWKPAMESWVMTNILDQLVLPRLLQEVENWNPLTDTTPIHCWLHPWLPLMGDKLEPLYAPIRHKIANALTNWHPSDSSAKIILEPWKGVFREGHMSAFLVKNILPKLELEIHNMTINPHHQILDPWRWTMSWKDMLPVQGLVSMLDKAFFPKWYQVLAAWLSNMPNYEDITKWYMGWKAQFPEILLGHPVIKDQLNKALELMNRAVSGTFVPGVKEDMAYFTHSERRIMDTKAAPAMENSPRRDTEPSSSRLNASSGATATFKDLVERRAEVEDLLYMPLPGKTYEAKQVYRFGKAVIYFDNHVVFMQDKDGVWFPTSIQALVDAAR